MIFLIGMSKAGKTEIGKSLASTLNIQFFDTDLEIQKKYNDQISFIYDVNGNQKFRDIEFNMLQTLSKNKNAVISTGGGIIENKDSRFFLNNQKTVVFIDTDPNIIFHRIEQYKIKNNHYPKFLGNVKNYNAALESFNSIYNNRLHFYLEVSTICFKPKSMTPNQIAKRLKLLLFSDKL